MERIWGGARSAAGTADAQSAGSREENQNIAFDLAYISYTSPIGLFLVVISRITSGEQFSEIEPLDLPLANSPMRYLSDRLFL